MYGIRTTPDFSPKSFVSPDNDLILPLHLDYRTLLSVSSTNFRDRIPIFFGSDEELLSEAEAPNSVHPQHPLTLFKPKILSHPTYPRLLQAYLDCHKVTMIYPPIRNTSISSYLSSFFTSQLSVASNDCSIYSLFLFFNTQTPVRIVDCLILYYTHTHILYNTPNCFAITNFYSLTFGFSKNPDLFPEQERKTEKKKKKSSGV